MIITSMREASKDELAREIDRRGEVIEQLERRLAGQMAGHQETARQSTANLLRATAAEAELARVREDAERETSAAIDRALIAEASAALAPEATAGTGENIPPHEGWRYGELIYRALYEHQGGLWDAVSDNNKDTVWYPAGYRLQTMLAIHHPTAEAVGECVAAPQPPERSAVEADLTDDERISYWQGVAERALATRGDMQREIDSGKKALDLYERALKEAEAILGREYGQHFGPFYDLQADARSALRAGGEK